ncbi:MAG: hypothetical protein FWD69_05865 [Polyangiaceae bacterium]|nr:hypothetical protein [Polyangiaceae bacterium]
MSTMHDPYLRDVRDVRLRNTEEPKRPATPKWVWPVVALIALSLLGFLFARATHHTPVMPGPTMEQRMNEPMGVPDRPNEPMRSPDQPGQPGYRQPGYGR